MRLVHATYHAAYHARYGQPPYSTVPCPSPIIPSLPTHPCLQSLPLQLHSTTIRTKQNTVPRPTVHPQSSRRQPNQHCVARLAMSGS